MARKRDFHTSPTATVAQQIGRMKKDRPEFRLGFNRKGIFWVGPLQPSALSETYKVHVEYALRQRPHVRVLSPELRTTSKDEGIPHTFADGSICLHVPGGWTPDMFVADTIIPWLGLWLLHYEYWLATGVWHGGGYEERTT